MLIGSGALLLLALVVLLQFGGRSTRVAGPVVPSGVGSGPLPVLREIRDFNLTNQAGATFSKANLAGGPWAINLIFTRCPGPCAQLSGVMRTVRSGLSGDSKARLLSLTSDPGFDTPEVLARYAAKVGSGTAGWTFVTGSRDEIRRLATEDLLLVLVDKEEAERESAEDLFLHSTMIILVDRKGRVRSAVEGLEAGAAARVLELLAILGREE